MSTILDVLFNSFSSIFGFTLLLALIFFIILNKIIPRAPWGLLRIVLIIITSLFISSLAMGALWGIGLGLNHII